MINVSVRFRISLYSSAGILTNMADYRLQMINGAAPTPPTQPLPPPPPTHKGTFAEIAFHREKLQFFSESNE